MDHEINILDKMLKERSSGTWLAKLITENPHLLGGQHSDNIMRVLDDQSAKIVAANKNFEKSISQLGRVEMRKSLTKDFLKGFIKGIVKERLKRKATAYFEGEAMIELMLEQYKYQAAYILHQETDTLYERTKDAYDTMILIRNAMVDKYDPASQMGIEKNDTATFPNGPRPYNIFLANNRGQVAGQSGLNIEVTLGGVRAIRVSNGALAFTIPADEIENIVNREEGAALEIKVLK